MPPAADIANHPRRTAMLHDWVDVSMVHFPVPSRRLQSSLPLPLDTFDGRAWVTLVPFRVTNMRCPILPRLTAALLRPVSDHPLVNVRTYVRDDASGDAGIYFLREFTSHRLNAVLAPLIYGTPYQYARIDRAGDDHIQHTRVTTPLGSLALSVTAYLNTTTAPPGSLDAFLLERYTAWCAARGRLMRFDIDHPPWRYRPAAARCDDAALLRAAFDWFPRHPATPLAHRCRALRGVHVSPPRRIRPDTRPRPMRGSEPSPQCPPEITPTTLLRAP